MLIESTMTETPIVEALGFAPRYAKREQDVLFFS
jgi:hypothetical protein